MKKIRGLVVFLLISMGLLAACVGTETSTTTAGNGNELNKITIAEPVHLIGYLPLYTAINEGYFKEEGLDVEVVTAAGGGHVTAVVGGDAWGNIGGPDSNAQANLGSSDPIVSIVNMVNRANVYLMGPDITLENDSPEELAKVLEGKNIAAGRFGGSPNLLTRWLIMEAGLDLEKDVTLEEPADAAAVVALIKNGQADIANGAEPQINEGIENEAWGEPFYGFPSLGDYPYSVLSVKKSSIEEDPETVQSFVNAIIKGLKAVNENEELAMKNLKQEFPTSDEKGLKAALDRAYKDELWSPDGNISEESIDKMEEVIQKTGIFKEEYNYAEWIDMQFVE